MRPISNTYKDARIHWNLAQHASTWKLVALQGAHFLPLVFTHGDGGNHWSIMEACEYSESQSGPFPFFAGEMAIPTLFTSCLLNYPDLWTAIHSHGTNGLMHSCETRRGNEGMSQNLHCCHGDGNNNERCRNTVCDWNTMLYITYEQCKINENTVAALIY